MPGKATVRGAVERELKRLPKDLADSGLAAAALALASDIDNSDTRPTARSMCNRELRENLERLRRMAPPREETDWLDELTARRDARRASASAH